MRSPSALHGYQASATGWLHDHPGSALFADLGLGKTVIALTLLARLKRAGEMRRALIIGPLRVVNSTWPDEIGAWSHTTGLTFTVVTGSASDRRHAATQDTDIHLINRENVVWLVDRHMHKVGGKWKLKTPWPYDVVICDELTGFGDHASERSKALARVRPLVKRFHGLTATPAAEGYMKMFAMTYLLDQGERFGKGITRYRDTYFNLNEYSRRWTPKPGAEDAITAKIADIVLTLSAEDHLPRDKPTVIRRLIHLTGEQMDTYERFEEDFYAEMPDGAEIEAVHAGALATKMLQLSSGFIYDAEHEPHWFHDHKIDELRELADEAQDEPLIIAYWFKPSLAKLRKAFPKAVMMDKDGKAAKAWNVGKIKMLLLHPASAGEGLNLQAGGASVVFFDIPAPYEKYAQTIGRVDRQGQTRPVRVYHLVSAGTADEMAVERLARKESVQAGFFERIKRWKGSR